MYALVLVTRDDEEFGEGWWEDKDGASLVLEDVELDKDEEFIVDRLASELAQRGSIYPGDTVEVMDYVTCVRYVLEVVEVYFDYDETLGLLPDAEETVIMDEITPNTTDERLNQLVEDWVMEIREATEVQPNRKAIEGWLRLVRDTARDLEKDWDKDWDNDKDYWTYDPDPLEIEVARGLGRLRKAKGD